MSVHHVIRVAMLLVLAGGVGLAYHRLHRTPEQKALTRFVESERERRGEISFMTGGTEGGIAIGNFYERLQVRLGK